MIFLSLFLFNISSFASEWTGVPQVCEQTLQSLNSQNALKDKVDWKQIETNMRRLGYPERLIEEKLSEVKWNADNALDFAREALGKPRVNWGHHFTRLESEKIGARLETYLSEDSIHYLHFWNSLKGFNSPAAVYAFLTNSGGRLDEESAKVLAKFAPLWLRTAVGFENAKLFYNNVEDEDAIANSGWLLQNLPLKSRARFLTFLKKKLAIEFGAVNDRPSEKAKESLLAASAMPWDKLPSDVRSNLSQNWLDLKKYKPLQTKDAFTIARGFEQAGDCRMMSNGHLRTLGLADCRKTKDDSELHQSVLIRLNGSLVGSLKLVGDQSMIALRNVIDQEGRLILAMGGVYHLDKDTVAEIFEVARDNSQWTDFNLEKLRVHPSSFMLNEDGWDEMNVPLLIALSKNSFTKEELVDIIGEIVDNNHSIPSSRFGAIWTSFLSSLDKFRIDHE